MLLLLEHTIRPQKSEVESRRSELNGSRFPLEFWANFVTKLVNRVKKNPLALNTTSKVSSHHVQTTLGVESLRSFLPVPRKDEATMLASYFKTGVNGEDDSMTSDAILQAGRFVHDLFTRRVPEKTVLSIMVTELYRLHYVITIELTDVWRLW